MYLRLCSVDKGGEDLLNGVSVPMLALGTWLADDDKAADVVRETIKIGYRHVGTEQANAEVEFAISEEDMETLKGIGLCEKEEHYGKKISGVF